MSGAPWHPFAVMAKVEGHEFVLVRGEGTQLWDRDGTARGWSNAWRGSSLCYVTSSHRSPHAG